MSYPVKILPLEIDVDTVAILKGLIAARSALAELKGVTAAIPNESILMSTLAVQEAKDSSEIENIITTNDDLFQSDVVGNQFISRAAKEVHSYAAALQHGYLQVKDTGLITNNTILSIQQQIEENRAGFRRLPGTELKNDFGETIYTPPQHPEEIIRLMGNLEQFINDDSIAAFDPLVKMAIIHHQFESIHPFYDGNGRTGRIINVLYLVQQRLLDIPVLYLSRYINQNKSEYYRLLQAVRTESAWHDWILYMLSGVEITSRQTTRLVQGITSLMFSHKHIVRDTLPKIYSQDLINNLFRHPYTKIEFVARELQVHRNTAARYLDDLVEIGLLTKLRLKKENYYLNNALFDLLTSVSDPGEGSQQPLLGRTTTL